MLEIVRFTKYGTELYIAIFVRSNNSVGTIGPFTSAEKVKTEISYRWKHINIDRLNVKNIGEVECLDYV